MSLDIEMVISMATNVSKVIVYKAPNPSPLVDILNRMATDNLARQLSCSWYVPNGAAEPAAEQIFQEMAAQGQSFFNASGDYDAYTGLIDFPGDSPIHHRSRRNNVDHERGGRGLGVGNGVELGQRDWQRRRHQHAISDSQLADEHQHDGQPGLDHDAEHAGRGADGGQCLCPGRWQRTTMSAAPVARRRCGRVLRRW